MLSLAGDGVVNASAPAIQPIAAVFSILVTAILAGLTGWYVHLTRSIAKASAAQAADYHESLAASRKQHADAVATLAQRLLTPLRALAPNTPVHEEPGGHQPPRLRKKAVPAAS